MWDFLAAKGEIMARSVSKQHNSARPKGRLLPWLAFFFTLLNLALVALIVQGLIDQRPPFVVNGWLVSVWGELGDSRGTILAQLIFVLGAAWAAILAPMVFRGEVTSLREAQESAIDGLRETNAAAMADLELSITGVVEELQRAAEQARNSLSAIQSYVLENVGFKNEYTFEDLGRAQQIIKEMQSVATALCQAIVSAAGEGGGLENAFGRMWPLYRPYILKMRELGLIDEADRDRFLTIADSRRYTREDRPDPVNVIELNTLNATLRMLRDKFERSHTQRAA